MAKQEANQSKEPFPTHRKLGIFIWIICAVLLVFYELFLFLMKLIQKTPG